MKLAEAISSPTQANTIAELVLAAQAGDREAFGELFERYRPTIVALALRRVRNADEAEELAQDVFVQAMQKLHQLRVPDAFGGWLRQIVHRMAINRLTRQRAALACDPETLEATCFSIDGDATTVAAHAAYKAKTQAMCLHPPNCPHPLPKPCISPMQIINVIDIPRNRGTRVSRT